LDKKVRVAFDWTLDLLFPKDVCAIYEPDPHRDFQRPNLIQGNVPSQRDRIETVRESYQAAN
jgi:hypothetical protein